MSLFVSIWVNMKPFSSDDLTFMETQALSNETWRFWRLFLLRAVIIDIHMPVHRNTKW